MGLKVCGRWKCDEILLVCCLLNALHLAITVIYLRRHVGSFKPGSTILTKRCALPDTFQKFADITMVTTTDIGRKHLNMLCGLMPLA